MSFIKTKKLIQSITSLFFKLKGLYQLDHEKALTIWKSETTNPTISGSSTISRDLKTLRTSQGLFLLKTNLFLKLQPTNQLLKIAQLAPGELQESLN